MYPKEVDDTLIVGCTIMTDRLMGTALLAWAVETSTTTMDPLYVPDVLGAMERIWDEGMETLRAPVELAVDEEDATTVPEEFSMFMVTLPLGKKPEPVIVKVLGVMPTISTNYYGRELRGAYRCAWGSWRSRP